MRDVIKTVLQTIAFFGGMGIAFTILTKLAEAGFLPNIPMGGPDFFSFLQIYGFDLLWSLPFSLFVIIAVPYTLWQLQEFILPEREDD